MKTKHFAVKIGKGMDDGLIKLTLCAKYFSDKSLTNDTEITMTGSGGKYGQDANIFCTSSFRKLRQTPIWNSYTEGGMTSYLTEKFSTGAEAQRFIFEVKEHINMLEHHISCLEREISALEC